MTGEVPRPEYPRPQWRRDRWTNLNGRWRFSFDDDDVGLAESWSATPVTRLRADEGPFDREIVVPFAYQWPMSGIDDDGDHAVVWYARAVDCSARRGPGERLLLHVGASDHDTTVWIDGVQVADHRGGYTPLRCDITDAIAGRDEVALVIRVADEPGTLDQPRGKQYWRQPSEYIFYRATTGIWQTVWLEPVSPAAIEDATVVPVLAAAAADVTMTFTAGAVGCRLRVTIRRGDHVLVADELAVGGRRLRRRWRLDEQVEALGSQMLEYQGVATWHPGNPRLYDIVFELLDGGGELVDRVESYFGMREVSAADGRVMLNGRPLYQRLVLDQGFHADGGYTAPSDEAIRGDIELAMRLGFNGARKHQKIADPRYLYWADRLGFLVWEEMPSAFSFTERAVADLAQQWQEAVVRDRNHPSIVAWVPINESWGAAAVADDPDGRQAHLLEMLYHLTKALDPTRLVVSNDGWEHTVTDLCTIHDYGDAAALRLRFADRDTAVSARPLDHPVYASGYAHRGEPIIVSEFGGISVAADDGSDATWGFHTVPDGASLLEHYREFVSAVVDSAVVAGFCWTQLADVEQETNGLVDQHRQPKAHVVAFYEATRQRGVGTGLERGIEKPDGT